MTFEEHVRAALDSLPPQLADALENVAVVIRDEHPEDPDLFGLYEGTPLPERSSAAAGHLPDQITIYRLPLERVSATPVTEARTALIDFSDERDVDGADVGFADVALEGDPPAPAASLGQMVGQEPAVCDVEPLIVLCVNEPVALVWVEPEHLPLHQLVVLSNLSRHEQDRENWPSASCRS